MKKHLLTLAVCMSFSFPSLASDADCGIWLCLPQGFPSGCGDAKSAFKDRLKKFKPPLPDFASCLLKDAPIQGSTMTSREQPAARMNNGSFIDGRECVRYVNSGGQDHELIWEPKGCIDTWYFAETFMDGQRYGEKFYYQR